MSSFHVAVCLLVPAFVATARPAGAQSPWVSLGDVGGQRTAVDTGAVVRGPGNHVTVRLRLDDFASTGADRIETLEMDCRGERSRLLAARDIVTGRSVLRALGADSVQHAQPADSTWRRFAPGSLGREQVRAVCSFLRARAANGASSRGADRPRPE